MKHNDQSPTTAAALSGYSLLSPPLQPIRMLSPQKKIRPASQKIMMGHDVTDMVKIISKEALLLLPPNDKHGDDYLVSHLLQKNEIPVVSIHKQSTFDTDTVVVGSPPRIMLATNVLTNDKIPASSPRAKSRNESEDESSAWTLSPAKQRMALRLPPDPRVHNNCERSTRFSFSSLPDDFDHSLLLRCDPSNMTEDHDDVVFDSLYDLGSCSDSSDGCSDHSFEDHVYEDFTATSFDDDDDDDDRQSSHNEDVF